MAKRDADTAILYTDDEMTGAQQAAETDEITRTLRLLLARQTRSLPRIFSKMMEPRFDKLEKRQDEQAQDIVRLHARVDKYEAERGTVSGSASGVQQNSNLLLSGSKIFVTTIPVNLRESPELTLSSGGEKSGSNSHRSWRRLLLNRRH